MPSKADRLLDSLTDAEIALLPGRLRREITQDPHVVAWAEAKSLRDAAIAAASTVDEGTLEVHYDAEAVAAAKDAWAVRKVELLAEG